MPKLPRLEIAVMQLLTGTWEAVIEVLKRSGHLSSFKNDHDVEIAWLLHCRGRNFHDEVRTEWFDSEYYVAYGSCRQDKKRHPWNLDTEPAIATNNLLKDIDLDLEDDDSESDVSDEMSDPGSTANYLQHFTRYDPHQA
ncbi:MAG: hypothetical protein Q9161_003461 [Pseudevernia consocians]